jgi:Zn-dependent protease with chaperone function
MPFSLKGKLESDELKSIIAPALIFQGMLGFRIRYYVAVLFFGPYLVGMGALGTFLGLRVLGLQRGSFAGLVFLAVFLIVYLLGFLFVGNRSARYCLGLWLTADRRAASVIGKQGLLHALEKIESMKLGDVELRKTRTMSGRFIRDRRSWRPSIIERIQNLLQDAE